MKKQATKQTTVPTVKKSTQKGAAHKAAPSTPADEPGYPASRIDEPEPGKKPRTPGYRRTPEEMERCRLAAIEELDKARERGELPITLRRLYYLLVSRPDLVSERALSYDGKPQRLIPKTELAYDNLSVMLCDLRREGRVDWEDIVDNTRDLDMPPTWLNITHRFESAIRTHRLDPWLDQPKQMIVTCEKDAISNIVRSVTYPYVVPLAVVRGFSSQTFLHKIAMRIREIGKPTYFFHLGDHDLAGFRIAASSQELLTEFVDGKVPLYFERLAVTPEQIDSNPGDPGHPLPTRPPKASDHPDEELGYDGRPVEVDALSMNVIRDLVQDAIGREADDDYEAVEGVLDFELYDVTIARQEREREQGRRIIAPRRSGR
jgi:hypothetical protein